MSENKECSLFLGVHVAENVLSYVFKDVERMPMHNQGYDFICNHGKKIDVKSSCMRGSKDWGFAIRKNTIADYFLLIAFDNRHKLNPVHVWLINGYVVNNRFGISIRESTIQKWQKYELEISDVIDCCDTLKQNR